MAVIRDVMPAFQLLQPTSIADAQKLLENQGHEAMVLAGGMDAFDWLKRVEPVGRVGASLRVYWVDGGNQATNGIDH